MSQPTDSEQPPAGFVHLQGSERKPRPSFRAVRPADPDESVRVVIKLRPKSEIPDPTELGSVRPSERTALPSDEVAAEQYGADPADVDAVLSWARQQPGVEIEEADAPSRLVVLSGSVSSMSAAFATKLERYESATGESYRGRTGHVHVPQALEPVITAVTGLDDRPQAKPRGTAMTSRHGLRRYQPVELAQIYSFPDQMDGSGECIGLLEFEGGYQQSDLYFYFNPLVGPPVPVT